MQMNQTKIIKETSPYIHKKSSVQRMMLDVLIALTPVVIFSIVMNGFKAVYVILISVFTMLLSELLFVFITKQDPYDGKKKTFKEKIKTCKNKATINNILTPLISAIIFAMIMPAGSNPYIVVIGSLAGIWLGKLLFGGLGSNIFNPAAVGRVFTMVCFGADITYNKVNFVDVVAGGTPLTQLNDNLLNIGNYSLSDLFFGLIPGSMGETSAIIILISGLYLFIRHSADFRPTLAMILTFMGLMFICGLKLDASKAFEFALYQTLAGGLLFGAVFMITDPVTSPTTKPGRVFYGVFVGIIAALIRLLGTYPEGVAFAILIMNMFVPVIDYYKWSSNKYTYKKIIVLALIIIVSALVIYFGVK